MEEVDRARFDEHLQRYTEADRRRIITEGQGRSILFLLYGAATVLALFIPSYLVVVRFTHTPAIGRVRHRRAGGLRRADPRMVADAAERDRQASRSAEAVYGYVDRTPDVTQAGGALFLAPLKDKITFENVGLVMPNGKRLLDGLSVEIRAGTRVAIMGPDEDSKYALACLIPRLDRPVGRSRADRRRGPARRDARVDPRPGFDRPPGRPDLQRHDLRQHRPGRRRATTSRA